MKLKTDWIVNQSPEKEMRSYLGTEKKIPTAYKMEKVAITAGTCYENVERNKNKLLSSTYICAGRVPCCALPTGANGRSEVVSLTILHPSPVLYRCNKCSQRVHTEKIAVVWHCIPALLYSLCSVKLL